MTLALASHPEVDGWDVDVIAEETHLGKTQHLKTRGLNRLDIVSFVPSPYLPVPPKKIGTKPPVANISGN